MPRDSNADIITISQYLPGDNIIQHIDAINQLTEREKNILATLIREKDVQNSLGVIFSGQRLYIQDDGRLSGILTGTRDDQDDDNDSLLFGTEQVNGTTHSWVQIARLSAVPLQQQVRHSDEDLSDNESDGLSQETLNIIRSTRLNDRLAAAQNTVDEILRIARATQKQAVNDPKKAGAIAQFIETTETLVELANQADTHPSPDNTVTFIKHLEHWNQSAQQSSVVDIKELSFRSKMVALLSGVVLGGIFAGIGFAIGGPGGAAIGAVIGAGLGWSIAVTVLAVKSDAISEQKRAESQNPHRLFSPGVQKQAAQVRDALEQAIRPAEENDPHPTPGQ